MKLTITLTCDNAAFENEPLWEMSRILSDLAKSFAAGEPKTTLHDINGNKVGTVEIEEN